MNRNFKSSFGVLILVSILSIVLPIPAVMAAAPLDVHIEVLATIDPTPDPFTATGSAVDAGLLCATGYQDELSFNVSGPPGGNFRILRVVKRFVCDDGSGTFDLRLVARLDFINHNTTGHWNVIGGTGDYARLHGNGKLIGIPIEPGSSILDVYDGRMH